MYVYGPMHVHGPQPIQAPHRTTASQAQSPAQGAADQLDISTEAELLMRVRELPEIRADRVAAIRAAIAAGTYETQDKLEIAVGRLLDEIG